MPSTPEILWPASPNSAPVAARIAVAGDFLPAGNLSFTHAESWATKTARLDSIFSNVDSTFANLESPVDVSGLAARPLAGIGTIVSAPVESLDYLRGIRAHAVGIANNHTFDFGPAGLERTREAVERAQMMPIGNCSSTLAPPSFYIGSGANGIRVGFWAAARASRERATRTRAGVEPATVARGREALAEMKIRGAHFCVALLHAGCLRTNRPEPDDVALMDALAGAGFHIVAASHSHRISGYKRITQPDGTPAHCFYGLGSLVSGYVASPAEREGLIVTAGLGADASLATLEVHAVNLDNSGFGAMPAPSDRAAILARFHCLSREISDGRYRRMFYDEVGEDLGNLYLRDVRAAYRQAGVAGLVKKAGRIRLTHVKRLFHKIAPGQASQVPHAHDRAASGAGHD